MLLFPVSAFCAHDISVVVDGNALVFDQPPIIQNNHVLIPIRAVFEAFGAEVAWIEDSKTATASKDGKSVSLSADKAEIIIDETIHELDCTPVLRNGRLLIPIRAAAEAFGAYVSWNESLKTVLIITSKKMEPISGKTYIIKNSCTQKALAHRDGDIVTESVTRYENQLWEIASDGRIYPYSADGAITLSQGRAILGNGDFLSFFQSGEIVTKSALVMTETAGKVVFGGRYTSTLSLWHIEEVTAVYPEAVSYSLKLKGTDTVLCFANDNLYMKQESGGEEEKWILTQTLSGNYVITSKTPVVTEDGEQTRSLDVSGGSRESGASVIAYRTGGAANQRWRFEKQSDGSYLIVSENSELCLTADGGTFTQQPIGSQNQYWQLLKSNK